MGEWWESFFDRARLKASLGITGRRIPYDRNFDPAICMWTGFGHFEKESYNLGHSERSKERLRMRPPERSLP